MILQTIVTLSIEKQAAGRDGINDGDVSGELSDTDTSAFTHPRVQRFWKTICLTEYRGTGNIGPHAYVDWMI